MPEIASKIQTSGVYARRLARRFESIGIDAFASQKERYLVLLEDSPGEVIDLGKPLRGTRIFATEAVRKNIPVVEDFAAFARVDGLENCVFWCVGLPGAKATPDGLATAMKAFNGLINVEFSELRKKHAFELLLIAIHPRFDPVTGLFDLHAHFVCRAKPGQREAIHRRLMTKFSRIDLKPHPIRNAAAVATFMLWGIWRNHEMLDWPDYALQAAWSLTQHRFRLFRAGGAFAAWRSRRRESTAKGRLQMDEATLQRNRRETADERQWPQSEDKLLSKVKVRYEGRKVAALLFEVERAPSISGADRCQDENQVYSSATIVVTQEPSVVIADNIENRSGRDSAPIRQSISHSVADMKSRLLAIPSKSADALRIIGAHAASAIASFVGETRRQLMASLKRGAKALKDGLKRFVLSG